MALHVYQSNSVTSVYGLFTLTVSVSVTVSVKFTLCEWRRIGTEPILSIQWSVSIGTMINFDGYGDGTRKQAFTLTPS